MEGDRWHVTYDTWHMTCDMWNIRHGEGWTLAEPTWHFTTLHYKKCKRHLKPFRLSKCRCQFIFSLHFQWIGPYANSIYKLRCPSLAHGLSLLCNFILEKNEDFKSKRFLLKLPEYKLIFFLLSFDHFFLLLFFCFQSPKLPQLNYQICWDFAETA